MLKALAAFARKNDARGHFGSLLPTSGVSFRQTSSLHCHSRSSESVSRLSHYWTT